MTMFSSFNSYLVYVFCKALLDFEEAVLYKTEFIIIIIKIMAV